MVYFAGWQPHKKKIVGIPANRKVLPEESSERELTEERAETKPLISCKSCQVLSWEEH